MMPKSQMIDAYRFLFKRRNPHQSKNLFAASLFSGAGLSDLGYQQAGFQFLAHSELDPNRAELCARNFPSSTHITGDLRSLWGEVVSAYKKQTDEVPALISITPPCQGMSSSNPGRGKSMDANTSDKRNLLLLATIPVIGELRPRIIVVENVPQVFQRVVQVEAEEIPCKILEAFARALEGQYRIFSKTVQLANYGVPQDRRRAIIVAIRVGEPCVKQLEGEKLLPLPRPTHAEVPDNGQLPWITLEQWFQQLGYLPLDASSPELARSSPDPLHFVPHYKGDRYLMVADIPPRSGRNAYQNSKCHECGRQDIPEGRVECPTCGALMRNRPYVKTKDGTYRLVRGFKSSYRRMHHDRPAPTVTTASSHIGSDNKIHPWSNRVLSIRECADLQTVPRFYDWQWAVETRHTYVARQVIGEALPPFFTFLHAQILRDLLDAQVTQERLASVP